MKEQEPSGGDEPGILPRPGESQGGSLPQNNLERVMSLSEDWEEKVKDYFPGIEEDSGWRQNVIGPGSLACYIVGDFIIRRHPEHFLSDPLIESIVSVANKVERIVGIRSKENDLLYSYDTLSRFSSASQRLNFRSGELRRLFAEALNELSRDVEVRASRQSL